MFERVEKASVCLPSLIANKYPFRFIRLLQMGNGQRDFVYLQQEDSPNKVPLTLSDSILCYQFLDSCYLTKIGIHVVEIKVGAFVDVS